VTSTTSDVISDGFTKPQSTEHPIPFLCEFVHSRTKQACVRVRMRVRMRVKVRVRVKVKVRVRVRVR
jgi:hypothetical protein